jgi:hypothetical protein
MKAELRLIYLIMVTQVPSNGFMLITTINWYVDQLPKSVYCGGAGVLGCYRVCVSAITNLSDLDL